MIQSACVIEKEKYAPDMLVVVAESGGIYQYACNDYLQNENNDNNTYAVWRDANYCSLLTNTMADIQAFRAWLPYFVTRY